MGSWAPSGWGALGGREEHTLQPSRLRAWELGPYPRTPEACCCCGRPGTCPVHLGAWSLARRSLGQRGRCWELCSGERER